MNKDLLMLFWVSLPEAHSVYVTLASFSIALLSSLMCVLKFLFFLSESKMMLFTFYSYFDLPLIAGAGGSTFEPVEKD